MVTYDKIKRNLFVAKGQQENLTPQEQEMSRRWAALFVLLMRNPLLSNAQLTAFITNGGIITNAGQLYEDEFKVKIFEPVSEATAYRDIREVQSLVGEMRRVTKDYLRHIIYETSMEMIQKGRENGDYEIVSSAMNHIIKAFKLDKDELEITDWEALPQPSFEPSGDMKLLGLANVPTIAEYEQQRQKLKQKLSIAN